MEDRECGNYLLIVYYYYLKDRLNIQQFNNLFHVRLPEDDLKKVEAGSRQLCESVYVA
jgi:hypothetical protein